MASQLHREASCRSRRPPALLIPPGSGCGWLCGRTPRSPSTCQEWRTRSRGHYVRLAVAADGSVLGFVEASKRADYVNGTSSSPVAFLEGLYVVPRARCRGVARTLVESVVRWALDQGCTELASDALIDNLTAHTVHRSLGFEETERVVYFRRALRDV